jgi:N-acetylglucosaminyl-diphospho-decaprenol L-rhamnosyltransferase
MGITEGVTAVVVTYRSGPTIETCLRSLPAAAGSRPLQVIVVDNASDDDTLARVQASGVPVEVVARTTNAWFSTANNEGLARATGDWVVFANPDTWWPPGSLDRLVCVATEHDDALICPALENSNGTLQPTVETDLTVGRVVRGMLRLGRAVRPSVPPSSGPPVEVDWAHGAAMLMSTTLARELGGFDQLFFLFFEDLDLCWRVRQAGGAVLVAPEVRVGHVGGASMKRSGDDAWVAGQRVRGLATFLAKRQGVRAARLYATAALVVYGLTPSALHRAMARAALGALRPVGRAGPSSPAGSVDG